MTHALSTIATLPVGLFDEIAIGREGFSEVFARYGLSKDFAEECRGDKRFQLLVNDRRVELEKAGLIHVHRAQAVADMTLTELARRVSDPGTPTPVLLSIYQTTAKLGRLEAPTGQVAVSGPGFSISINLNGSKPAEKVVESEAIEHDDLGPAPEYLKVNDELEYKD